MPHPAPAFASTGAPGAGSPATNACANVGAAPCGGGAPAGSATAIYIPGQATTISLLKNQDHLNAAAPGNFSVYLWDAAGEATFLGAVPDSTAPTLSLYPVSVIVPSAAQVGNYTLQAIYYTNNAAAPPAFYSCSDVQII